MSAYASMRDDVVLSVCTLVDDHVCVVTMRSDEHDDFPERAGGLFDESEPPRAFAPALPSDPLQQWFVDPLRGISPAG
jgi:hypothetical protein